MSDIHEVLSPLPGTFYRSPSPEEPPFKSEGDEVAVGDVLGLVEVMKQFSYINAEAAGRVGKFQVENGAPVDPGQVIVTIQPA
ncbi:MAG: acetyl-CoA carboxylase [Castellaniella sp.]|uniref:acetyl-CoA carboxylase n=1 Tax=Castellaniella sp. TaxID=1955812 RepID=UPI003A85845B